MEFKFIIIGTLLLYLFLDVDIGWMIAPGAPHTFCGLIISFSFG